MTHSKVFWTTYAIAVFVLTAIFAFLYKSFIFTERDPLNDIFYNKTSNITLGSIDEIVETKIPTLVFDAENVSTASIPSRIGFQYEIYDGTSSKVDTFARTELISFGAPRNYSPLEGITCFRGNNFNNSASYGLVSVEAEALEESWSTQVGYIGDWTGVGWNGQPLIVKWDSEAIKGMNFKEKYKSYDTLTEVIYGTLDGKVYFLDLANGEYTRTATIDIGAPIKGTVTLDPRGYPLLYVGQGDYKNGDTTVPFAYRIFSLTDFTQLYSIQGLDGISDRSWGAFDSTSKIDKNTDTMILCGENGIVYFVKLNTSFDMETYKISISPTVEKYYYTPLNTDGTLGIESTPAFYKNYMFFTDNNGTLQCLDTNTLTPQWVYNVTDDSDSSVCLEAESDEFLALYTACEIDRQGNGGYSYLRKFDAMTGKLQWEKRIGCLHDDAVTGGTIATAVVGKCDISNLVIYNVGKVDNSYRGRIYALDKNTGKEVWSTTLRYYSWSSPVAVYTEDGKSYIIVCDSYGFMMLIEGTTGNVLHTINLNANIEGSPAVFGNEIVVGTRGQRIYKVKIR